MKPKISLARVVGECDCCRRTSPLPDESRCRECIDRGRQPVRLRDLVILLVAALIVWAIVAVALASCDVVPGDPLRPRAAAPSPDPSEDFAIVSWEAPTVNADGTTLDDLAGYRVYHRGPEGTERAIDVGLALEHRLEDLGTGVHAFAVAAIDNSGNESERSQTVSKAIR